MSGFEEYINSLEGQSELDVSTVVQELHKLHKQEIGIGAAKIEQLTGQIATANTTIAEKDGEISRVKAANWDLVNQIPAQTSESSEENDDTIDQKRITLDDAFAQ